MPGPLPDPNARRRNKRKPGTPLPLDGPEGRTPTCPYSLKKAGKKWWNSAWKLPQATAWDDGSVYFVARRAQLEDDLALADSAFESTDFAEMLGRDEDEITRDLEFIVGRLAALAGRRLPILKEMREMDNKLGLNPKAMADLRWTIEAPEESGAVSNSTPKKTAKGRGGSRGRLRAVA
jgi:hypothetical protein